MAQVTKVTVTTAATRLAAADGMRKALMIKNNGVASIFVGSTNQVTTATGLEVPQGIQLNVEGDTDDYWGICAAGTQACDVVEIL